MEFARLRDLTISGRRLRQITPEVLAFVMAELDTVPPYVGVPLLFDHCAQDWRDVRPRIDVDTLVIGCDGSYVDPSSRRYIADQIPHARLHVFPTDVASSHFPFLENPAEFNRVLENSSGPGDGSPRGDQVGPENSAVTVP
jgi:pimeloyl-ACP methyl ester carboxylesterase